MKKIITGSIVKNPTTLLKGATTDHLEDRSAFLRSDSVVKWTGTQLEFASNIVLEILNTSDGTLTQHTILAADSPVTIANNESAYIVIDRTQTAENISIVKSGTTPIPQHADADKEVFVLFKRIDASAAYLYLPFTKQLIEPNQNVRLGETPGQKRAGTETLGSGVSSKAVVFSSAMPDTNYAIKCELVNTTDVDPQIQPITITAKSTTGFTAKWSDDTDSANYSLDYTVEGHK